MKPKSRPKPSKPRKPYGLSEERLRIIIAEEVRKAMPQSFYVPYYTYPQTYPGTWIGTAPGTITSFTYGSDSKTYSLTATPS